MLVTSVCCGLIPFFAGMAFYFKTVAGERQKTALPILLAASILPPALVAAWQYYNLNQFYYVLLCPLSLGWAGLVFGALGYFFRRDREDSYR